MSFKEDISALARLAITGFILLVAALSYQQIAMGGRYRQNPLNKRASIRLSKVKEGAIRDRVGVILAETQRVGTGFGRVYPLGRATCHVVGYDSTKVGSAGLQKRYRSVLLGNDGLESPLAQLLRDQESGHDLVLTLDASAQRTATEALEGRTGAVVALDPQTGDVLVMASSPTFNPNFLEDAWDVIRKDPSSPLLNRCTQGQYPPGSTFALLTSAAALDAGVATLSTKFRCEGHFRVDGDEILCHRRRGHGLLNMREALVVSCNVYFAKLGLKIGWEGLQKTAEAFGFGKATDFDLPVASSSMPPTEPGDRATLAEASLGQGNVVVTPLQMGMLVAAIGNDGRMMAPRLVQSIRSVEGRILRTTEPREISQPVSAETADALREVMTQVVKRGTGAWAKSEHVEIAGETGTAENPSGAPHAWFVGLAPAATPRVAVAVVIENADNGIAEAASVAKKVVETLLE